MSDPAVRCYVLTYFALPRRNIRDLFGQLRARAASRCVIVFLDEVDGLCRRRSNEETESTRRMKTELLTQLQGDAGVATPATPATPCQDGHLFFICATNCPWEIDPAFLRRFQRRIFIGMPDRWVGLPEVEVGRPRPRTQEHSA